MWDDEGTPAGPNLSRMTFDVRMTSIPTMGNLAGKLNTH